MTKISHKNSQSLKSLDFFKDLSKLDSSKTSINIKRQKTSTKHHKQNKNDCISIQGATVHNLKNVSVDIPRNHITLVTGVSGSGKSSLVFDTLLKEAKYNFFSTLSHYDRSHMEFSTRAEARSITGLSLAISLDQIENAPSSRATIASFTNIGELLSVLYATFAHKHCPYHPQLICAEESDTDTIASQILKRVNHKKFCLVIPLVINKKGAFAKEFTKAKINQFHGVAIDNKFYKLPINFTLSKKFKHTIKFIYKVLQNPSHRELVGHINDSDCFAKDAIEIFYGSESQIKDWLNPSLKYSHKSGCPECGYSYEIDSRYFSTNSLGRCTDCNGMGYVVDESNKKIESHLYQKDIDPCKGCHGTGLSQKYSMVKYNQITMTDLYNKELNDVYRFVKSIAKDYKEDNGFKLLISELYKEFNKIISLGLGHLSLCRRLSTLSNGERQRLRLSSILIEPLSSVLYILDEPSQGLHPADLDNIWQSIKILRDLGNTIIIIDHDDYFLNKSQYIIDMGPGGGRLGGMVTAEFFYDQAAKFCDKSFSAARIIKKNNQYEILNKTQNKKKDKNKNKNKNKNETNSKTDPIQKNFLESFNKKAPDSDKMPLIELKPQLTEKTTPQMMIFNNINFRHLNIDKLLIHNHKLNVVSGVSGSSKTTLVMAVIAANLRSIVQTKKQYILDQREKRKLQKLDYSQLTAKQQLLVKQKEPKYYQAVNPLVHISSIQGYEFIEDMHIIDRRPMGKSKISIPATYLGCMDYIREIFAKLPASQMCGLTKGHFSFASKGSCSHCKGRGYISYSSVYLNAATQKCPYCDGKRFKKVVLQIKYKNHSITDILNMTISDAAEFFKNHKYIAKILNNAINLGLGYLTLGQPSTSVSGGEAQRMKILSLLNKSMSSRRKAKTEVILIDEPTRGLHNNDVDLLITLLKKMTTLGHTFIVIEHHQGFIKSCDYLIELGNGAGKNGGKLVYQGSKANFFATKPEKSLTYHHIIN